MPFGSWFDSSWNLFHLLPGPTEEVASVDVAGVSVCRPEDDDNQLASVALAPRDEAGAGGGRGAGLDARVAVDGQKLVRVFPNNVALVAAIARDSGAVLAGADVLAKERVLHRGVGEFGQVAGRRLMIFGRQSVRIFV